jgi:hypothetical protein
LGRFFSINASILLTSKVYNFKKSEVFLVEKPVVLLFGIPTCSQNKFRRSNQFVDGITVFFLSYFSNIQTASMFSLLYLGAQAGSSKEVNYLG